MSETTEQPDRATPTTAWSDAPSRDALRFIAEGVTELAGFGVAAVSVARDDGYLEVMAVAGSDAARRQLQGVRTPVDKLLAELEKADEWGLLRFVPHERLDRGIEPWGWVPDVTPLEGPDAWHPLDLLIAPLRDDDGVLRGTLSIDIPVDGRRPGPAQRRVLQKYAEQAGRAVVTTLEREALAEQVRLADAARRIIRTAAGQLTLDRLLAESQLALIEGFQALGMWIQTFDEDGSGTGALHSSDGLEVVLPPDLVAIAERTARRAWDRQGVDIVGAGHPFGPAVTEDEGRLILEFLAGIEVGSLLFVPLGAGTECLGNLVLTRAAHDTDWTDVECTAALDIGHDLGRAILTARMFEREHQLVEELQALDSYKTQLIATVSHELKNPLTAILGHLEILEAMPDLAPAARGSLAAMGRGAHRLERVVDDLLLLSKVGDPHNPVLAVPVDLRRVVADVVDLTAVSAERKRLVVRVDAPDEPVRALGDPDELDRACANLLSNAVKYTPEGQAITISLARLAGEIVLTCADEGIGISVEDQAQLFSEFFRSTNPVALAQPGTGLGLAIVRRIVARHEGRIEVESELGAGSTFRMFLPATD